MRTHDPVFRMAGRLTRDLDLRRDWTHEVLLGILTDLERGRFELRRPGGFWAWFRKRAYYRLLNEYSRHRRRALREVTSGGEDDSHYTELASSQDLAEEIERAEFLTAIESCLEKLPSSDQRRSLALLLFDDLPYEGIAEAMGAQLNTVKSWIRRGRLTLRQCVAAAMGWIEGGADAGR